MDELKGNITFVSNLFPVEKENIIEDIKFCQHIEDPKRIFEMKCNPLLKTNFPFTKKQESIFHVQSGWHCKLCKEDMPFGAICTSDGLIKEICKCEETDCSCFQNCINLE